jgi:hypothetical protein
MWQSGTAGFPGARTVPDGTRAGPEPAEARRSGPIVYIGAAYQLTNSNRLLGYLEQQYNS